VSLPVSERSCESIARGWNIAGPERFALVTSQIIFRWRASPASKAISRDVEVNDTTVNSYRIEIGVDRRTIRSASLRKERLEEPLKSLRKLCARGSPRTIDFVEQELEKASRRDVHLARLDAANLLAQ